MLGRILIAVSVYRNNTVGIFRNNRALGVHTEGAHLIPVFLCPVYNFTLVQFICQVRKYLCRKLYTDSNIHTVGAGRNLHIPANPLHPFASASTHRNNTFFAAIRLSIGGNLIAAVHCSNRIHRRIKIKINLFLQLCIQIFQNLVVNIRTQMTH